MTFELTHNPHIKYGKLKLCFEGFYNEPPSIAKCPFFLHSKPHDYPQMSQLPSKCHDYPPNVTITLKMSQLPSKKN